MKTANVEFIAFDAQDVIATSGKLYLYGMSAAAMMMGETALGTTVSGNYSNYFKQGNKFSVQFIGDDRPELSKWYEIGSDFQVNEKSGNYHLVLTDSGVRMPGAGDIKANGTAAEALQTIADWLSANGNLMVN